MRWRRVDMNMEHGIGVSKDSAKASAEAQQSAVRNYYGEVLHSSSDLRTTACCSIDAMAEPLRLILSPLHPEVRDRFSGCGSP